MHSGAMCLYKGHGWHPPGRHNKISFVNSTPKADSEKSWNSTSSPLQNSVKAAQLKSFGELRCLSFCYNNEHPCSATDPQADLDLSLESTLLYTKNSSVLLRTQRQGIYSKGPQAETQLSHAVTLELSLHIGCNLIKDLLIKRPP